MKYLILFGLFSLVCIFFTGCASDEHQTSQTSSATMTYDGKDMHSRSH